jgi:hypothetical protein
MGGHDPHSQPISPGLPSSNKKNTGCPSPPWAWEPSPWSRACLCAQCGSVLNYGYLGDEPTAPGQWDAGSLKRAITRLPKA